jgi:hypothetical protein
MKTLMILIDCRVEMGGLGEMVVQDLRVPKTSTELEPELGQNATFKVQARASILPGKDVAVRFRMRRSTQITSHICVHGDSSVSSTISRASSISSCCDWYGAWIKGWFFAVDSLVLL